MTHCWIGHILSGHDCFDNDEIGCTGEVMFTTASLEESALAAACTECSTKWFKYSLMSEVPTLTPSQTTMKEDYDGPFPNFGRPSADECRVSICLQDLILVARSKSTNDQQFLNIVDPYDYFTSMQQVTEALADLHGHPVRAIDPLAEHCGGQTLVLDSLIRTLLSQNTTDITSIRAFKTLKERFPTWEAVLQAPNLEIEDAIRVGGLAAIKTERMKTLLATLKEERGSCCLEWLRHESTDAIKTFLARFKGIGPKTVSCVLLFCLGRSDFPVDTHVHHISKSLHWCPTTCSREQCYQHLNILVPDGVKYALHVLLVQHGKHCSTCGKGGRRNTSKEDCPLVEFRKLKKRESLDAGIYDKVKKEEAGEEEKASGKRAGKKRPKVEAAAAVPKSRIKVEKIKKEENDGNKEPNDAKVHAPAVVKIKEEN